MTNQITTIEQSEKLLELEVKKFELEQRRATALSKSAFFPANLKGDVASAVIIYDLANRMNLSVLEIAQSVFIIRDKPSFSTQFLTARLNQSGLIKGRLRTIISDDKQSAYCEAIDAQTGELLKGMTVTMDIARKEGWLGKNGSKWQTMPELMLRYRAQSFFISEFFSEVKFGLKTKEEMEDIADVQIVTKNVDLNDVVNSDTQTKEQAPIIDLNAVISETQQIEKQELDLKQDLKNELIRRGVFETRAKVEADSYNDEQIAQILDDQSSIDAIAENCKD
ncbi:hypothetical protein CDQ71_00080 [Campylobacter hyointestinalis subsp. hyointestinalis]|uniref:hypothetical protein n=1 Tax=Campylobacter hyointestinalis TaxID=198 RepID=UPI000CE3312D|nr:hypothetical protein [Campylobacter hyointestinalis]PPB58731.1 hypothetical protein CDQ71_00080 [Campylobacter hyointestinalis subsp. hyointestinalis]